MEVVLFGSSSLRQQTPLAHVPERHPPHAILLRAAFFNQPLLHLPIFVSLAEDLDILRRRSPIRPELSDEQHSLHAFVVAVYASKRVTDDVVAIRLGEPVVDWIFDHEVIDPFVWDAQFVHDDTGVGVVEIITSNKYHLECFSYRWWCYGESNHIGSWKRETAVCELHEECGEDGRAEVSLYQRTHCWPCMFWQCAGALNQARSDYRDLTEAHASLGQPQAVPFRMTNHSVDLPAMHPTRIPLSQTF